MFWISFFPGLRVPAALFPFPVYQGSQVPSLWRGSKAHPWSWMRGRVSAERQPSRPLDAEYGASIAFHRLEAAVTDADSQGANLAALPWAPEGKRWRMEETKPSLRSCWRMPRDLHSAEGGQHPPAICIPSLLRRYLYIVGVHSSAGGSVCFVAGSVFESSALASRWLALNVIQYLCAEPTDLRWLTFAEVCSCDPT